jgi:hypothetical protein
LAPAQPPARCARPAMPEAPVPPSRTAAGSSGAAHRAIQGHSRGQPAHTMILRGVSLVWHWLSSSSWLACPPWMALQGSIAVRGQGRGRFSYGLERGGRILQWPGRVALVATTLGLMDAGTAEAVPSEQRLQRSSQRSNRIDARLGPQRQHELPPGPVPLLLGRMAPQ